MAVWVLWLIAAAALAIAETLSVDLVLGMFAGGALAGALAAGLGAGVVYQVLAFAVASVGLLIVVRPVAKRHLLEVPAHSKTGIARLIGQDAVVIEPVNATSGRVRLNGAVWSAAAYDETQQFGVGEVVHVMEIRGATAIVFGEI